MSPCTPSVVAPARRGALPWKVKFHSYPPGIERVGFVFPAFLAHRSPDHAITGNPKNQEKNMFTDVVTATPHIPRINEPAPQFEAKSTHGVIRLSDYTSKGKWVLL